VKEDEPLKGIPPDKMISLRAGTISRQHVRCCRCGYDLFGLNTEPFFEQVYEKDKTVLGSDKITTCPECGERQSYEQVRPKRRLTLARPEPLPVALVRPKPLPLGLVIAVCAIVITVLILLMIAAA
jgi:hypothetical protein